MTHSAMQSGGDESRYDLTPYEGSLMSDCASFMDAADLDLRLPPEGDDCGGCSNSECCGYCPCCATDEREQA